MKKLLTSLLSALFLIIPAFGMQEAAPQVNIEPVKTLLATFNYLNQEQHEKCMTAVDSLLNPIQTANDEPTLAQQDAKARLLDHLLGFVDYPFVTEYLKRIHSEETINNDRAELRQTLQALEVQKILFCYYVINNTFDSEEAVLALHGANDTFFATSPTIHSIFARYLNRDYAIIMQKQDTLSKIALDSNVLQIIKKCDEQELKKFFTVIWAMEDTETKDRAIFGLCKNYIRSSSKSSVFLDPFIDPILKSLTLAEKEKLFKRLLSNNYIHSKKDMNIQDIRKKFIDSIRSKWNALQVCWGVFAGESLDFSSKAIALKKNLRENAIKDLQEMEITSSEMLAHALDIDVNAIAQRLNVSCKDIERLSMHKFAFVDLAINGSLYAYGLTLEEIEKVWDELDGENNIKERFMQWISNKIAKFDQKRLSGIITNFATLKTNLNSFFEHYKPCSEFTRNYIQQYLNRHTNALPLSIKAETKALLDEIIKASNELQKHRANTVSSFAPIIGLDTEALAERMRISPQRLANLSAEQFIVLEIVMEMKKNNLINKKEIADIFDCFNLSNLIKNATTHYDFSTSGMDSIMPLIIGGSLAYLAYKMPKGFLKSFMR